ncbi:MAG: retropepsin-like domain-containing protein [Treponema sp.]|nr:retropepsin-like domain-containing protein [Treponema sp.]
MRKRGLIKEQDVREVTLDILPDTGASTLVITEEVREKLGLAVQEESFARVASGARHPCKKTEPVEILWEDRSAVCSALVLDSADVNLLGAIPLEAMDLRVNPVDLQLEGVHGDKPLHMAL